MAEKTLSKHPAESDQQKAIRELKAFLAAGKFADFDSISGMFENVIAVRLASSPEAEGLEREFTEQVENKGLSVEDINSLQGTHDLAVIAACEALFDLFVGFGLRLLCSRLGIELANREAGGAK